VILVKLRGGLSNQMFQYAAARRLAAIHDTQVRIDTSWYGKSSDATPRRYELNHLRPTGRIASHWETIGTEGVRNTPYRELPVALYRKARPRYRFIAERHFHFDPTVLQLPDSVCLFGYWQSEKYFADVANAIRDEFTFATPPSHQNEGLISRMAATNSVAIHVRRADYASDHHLASIHGQCGPEYYSRAMMWIADRTTDPQFFVFGDDLDWAADHLPSGANLTFVDNNRGSASYEDLRLMSLTRHNIIANSTFSWWAAWLNQSEGQIVCAPKVWMLDPQFDCRDVLPDGWITL
jgi:hypothetical protein